MNEGFALQRHARVSRLVNSLFGEAISCEGGVMRSGNEVGLASLSLAVMPWLIMLAMLSLKPD